jgi:hypothetical protein
MREVTSGLRLLPGVGISNQFLHGSVAITSRQRRLKLIAKPMQELGGAFGLGKS